MVRIDAAKNPRTTLGDKPLLPAGGEKVAEGRMRGGSAWVTARQTCNALVNQESL
jgi:hypothetical protein